MDPSSQRIGALRKFTNRPARAFWLVMALVVVLLFWSLQDQRGGASEQGWGAVLEALCAPGGKRARPRDWLVTVLLWHAMTLAMMLPAAVPMISAYLNIAAAAHEKSLRVAAASYLAAGYCAVWLAFSTGAAILQILIYHTPVAALAEDHVAAGVLILAGIYQFAPLKHACLKKCRAPMPYFLSHWSERRVDVFRMGLEQGLLCLGCCVALMLLMLAVGLMNIFWMAGLSILVLLEKTLPRPQSVVYGSGAGLIAAGLLLLTWE